MFKVVSFFCLPWQLEFCMEWNSLNNFKSGPPNDHSCEVWWNQPSGLGDVLSKLLTDDGQWIS